MSRQELMKLLWESECDLILTTDKQLKDPLGRIIGGVEEGRGTQHNTITITINTHKSGGC